MPTPSSIATAIRRQLNIGGSPNHAKGVQWFFKEEIKSRGWYTAALRKAAVQTRRTIIEQHGLPILVQLADKLFSGRVLEEKIFAVFLLENMTGQLGDADFRLFESWLPRISTWADHDGLVYYLISPMLVAKPSRSKNVFRWAKSRNRWHRRAACVALIRGARQKLFFTEIQRLTTALINDPDDMVQKGLGWLLRETAKFDPKRTALYLKSIAKKCPRLVLRTACETLPPSTKNAILACG